MVDDNHFQSPVSEDSDIIQDRRIRRTLVYLKRMHDDPAAYKRRLSFRAFFYFIIALVALLVMQLHEETTINAVSVICLVLFSMFMHLSQLCRLANSSLDLNMTIIDWSKVEKLLEEQDEH